MKLEVAVDWRHYLFSVAIEQQPAVDPHTSLR
jgi:hypothetical protein